MHRILLLLLIVATTCNGFAQVNDYRFEFEQRNNFTFGNTYLGNTAYNVFRVPTGSIEPYLFTDTLGTTDFDATRTGIPIGFDFIFDNDTFNRFALSSQGFLKLGKSTSPFTILQDTTIAGIIQNVNNVEKANVLSFFSRSISAFPDYDFLVAAYRLNNNFPGERILQVLLQLQGGNNNVQLDLHVFLYEGTNAITYYYQLRYPLATEEVAVGLRGNQANTDPSNLHFRKVVSGQNTWFTSDTSDGSHFCDIDTASFPYTAYSAPVFVGRRVAFDFYPIRWRSPDCTEAYIVEPYRGLSGIIDNRYAWLRGRTDANRDMILQWAPAGYPMMYDIYLDTDNPPTARIATDLTETRYRLPLLAPNTKYYIRIVPHTPTEYGNGCPVDSFTTGMELQYCDFSPQTSANLNQLVRKVDFGDIHVVVPPTGPYPFQYPDAAPYTTGLKRDSTYDYTVQTAAGPYERPQVLYIDYNQNGVFEYPDEQVLAARTPHSSTVSYPIHIPATAKLGRTMMQALYYWDFTGPVLPCFGAGNQYYLTILPETRCATLTMNPVATPAVCPGDSGTIALNPSGGTGPFKVYWADDTSNHSITRNLAPGWDYSAWVTDSIGCIFEKEYMVLGHGPPAEAPDTLRAGICDGDSYSFHGTVLSVAGTYNDTLAAVQGCDSVVVLLLDVLPTVSTALTGQVCNGDSYAFGGQSLTLAGTYTDTLMAINGCDSVVTLNLQVLPVLSTQLSDSICPGDTMYFAGQALTAGGMYPDTLTATGGCDSIVTLVLGIYNEPEPAITTGSGNTLSTGQFDNYQWYLDGTAMPGATQGSITAIEAGDYTVRVTDDNGCTATSAALYYVPVGIENVEDLNLAVYPNPNNGTFVVSVPKAGTLRLYSPLGELLHEAQVAHGIVWEQGEKLPPGLYLIAYMAEGNTITQKLVVTR